MKSKHVSDRSQGRLPQGKDYLPPLLRRKMMKMKYFTLIRSGGQSLDSCLKADVRVSPEAFLGFLV